MGTFPHWYILCKNPVHPRELTALVLVIGLMGFDVECVNAANRLWWELLHPQWLHYVQELPQQLPAQHGVWVADHPACQPPCHLQLHGLWHWRRLMCLWLCGRESLTLMGDCVHIIIMYICKVLKINANVNLHHMCSPYSWYYLHVLVKRSEGGVGDQEEVSSNCEVQSQKKSNAMHLYWILNLWEWEEDQSVFPWMLW